MIKVIAGARDGGMIHAPWDWHVQERAHKVAGMIAGARDGGIIHVP